MEIKNQISVFKDILQLIEESITIIKRHPKFFAIIFVAVLCYHGLKYITYINPKEVIQEYYSSINEREFDNAWYKLSERFKKDVFKNDKEKFIRSYSTTNHFGNIEVEFTKSMTNPLNDILRRDRVYKTKYEVEDRLKKEDLTDSGMQAWNSFWVEVQEETSLRRLKNSTQKQFVIRRVFHQDIRIIREKGRWKITQIKISEIGLKK